MGLLQSMEIDVQLRAERKEKLPAAQFGFGEKVSDHMLVMTYDADAGGWNRPEIKPYQSFSLEPRALVLHYGQSIFEGLKAFRRPDGHIALFRPEQNIRRMNASARKMAMPEIPEALFMDALLKLVDIERDWVPAEAGASLYIRPLMFGSDAVLGVRAASRYILCVMLSPVPPYFVPGGKPFKLLAREDCARTVAGGTGDAKTAANYGRSLVPLDAARREGYDNLLWLDSEQHRFVEEAGITNVFVQYADRVVTPPLSGRILPGITRDSVIRLLRDEGRTVLEQETDIGDLVRDIDDGRVHEIFLTGTATVVAPVDEIGFRGRRHALQIRDDGLALSLYRQLTQIQYGLAPDRHGWMRAL